MPVQIFTSNTIPYYTQKVTLDGQTFTLEFKWNIREEFWYMNLLNDDNVAIVSGIKIVTNWPLLRRVTNEERPLGDFFAYDITDVGTEAGFEELGERVLLLYFSQAELAEING